MCHIPNNNHQNVNLKKKVGGGDSCQLCRIPTTLMKMKLFLEVADSFSADDFIPPTKQHEYQLLTKFKSIFRKIIQNFFEYIYLKNSFFKS